MLKNYSVQNVQSAFCIKLNKQSKRETYIDFTGVNTNAE